MSKSDPAAESELSSRPPESDEPIRICALASVLVEVDPRTSLPTAWLILASDTRMVISFGVISPKSAGPS
jgi:hypothetical protein